MPTKELTPQQQQNKYGLSIIADFFFLSFFISTVSTAAIRKLRHSPLKLFALDYQINQLNWVGRFKKAAKQYEKEYGDKVNEMLQKDVSGDELEIYYAAIMLLKDAPNMEIVTTLIEYCNKLGDKLPDVAPKLIMWLKNEVELNK